jgi:hypothetical protein
MQRPGSPAMRFDAIVSRKAVAPFPSIANLPVLLGDLFEPAGLPLETRFLRPVRAIRKAERALPAETRAEHRARRFELFMHGRAPQAAARFAFGARPMDAVIVAIGLNRPLLQVAPGAVRAAEAAYVEGPQIHAGIAVEDPIRHRFAGAARSGDAGGEAASHEEIVELGREPQDRFAVGRDRYRPVDDRLDADLVEDRQSFCTGQREQLEPLHVLGEQFPAEGERRARPPATLGALLPSADRERADIGLEIKVLVGIAERRERSRQIEFLLGDEILVLDDTCRKRDARHVGDAFRPESSAVDEVLATDRPMIGRDPHDLPAIFKDARDGRALLQRCAILARD